MIRRLGESPMGFPLSLFSRLRPDRQAPTISLVGEVLRYLFTDYLDFNIESSP